MVKLLWYGIVYIAKNVNNKYIVSTKYTNIHNNNNRNKNVHNINDRNITNIIIIKSIIIFMNE